MPKTKQAATRRRRKEIAPVLGVVGVSLSLASGASAAAVVGPESNIPFNDAVTDSESLSPRRRFPTSALGRSMSSTRRTQAHPNSVNNMPGLQGLQRLR